MSAIRRLGPGDEGAVERFLLNHPDTTMFLRGNLRDGGLVDRGETYQGTWAGAFADGELAGVASHTWTGNLVLEAPAGLAELARTAVAGSGRPISGIVGRCSQVAAARRALRLGDVEVSIDSCEILSALDLAELQVPEILASGRARCRPPHDREIEQLTAWRAAYEQETLGMRPGPELDRRCEAWMERARQGALHWVLEDQGAVVSYTAFNATLPDCVQVGGVFTPPQLRGRGYARAAVAGSLLLARGRGVGRSTLFTQPENTQAQAAYRALGYRPVGDYGLLLFAEPQRVPAVPATGAPLPS